uniref:Ig-like domain-containing protein n=1 Tax=Calidris pygmaea TaxID=425635 RepID=A0A8C3J895_9CHAR
MQPPRCHHLLLFLLLLLPGTRADPEGKSEPWLIPTCSHHCTAGPHRSGREWAQTSHCPYHQGDIVFATLDKYTRNILYLYPWVYPALPAAEWENLQNLFKIYEHNFILSLQYPWIPFYPFVIQCATGCDLYPNGSYTKFYHLAYNAHHFLSFDVDKSHWERQQESELAAKVESQFNTFTGFSATLQHLLNVTCIDHMKKFIEYGRADLERQELPVATVFARTPRPEQLLLVCHVTGFYPRPISVSWLRDGQEVPPGPALNTSAILPNADLTYQLQSQDRHRGVLPVSMRTAHAVASDPWASEE